MKIKHAAPRKLRSGVKPLRERNATDVFLACKKWLDAQGLNTAPEDFNYGKRKRELRRKD
jgi:hypothetical protein